MKKNKIILFDFDGVIVDSIGISFAINKEWDASLEYSRWQSWFEGNVYQGIDSYLVEEETQIEFFKKYKVGLNDLLPVGGIGEVLKKINLMKYKLVIISSGSEKAIEDFLEKYNLKQYFVEIMARETHRSKVKKIEMILKKYKIKPNETLIVTDTIGDVKEAKEVKIKAIGVGWGVHEVKRLTENGADFIAETPKDILNGIKKILTLN